MPASTDPAKRSRVNTRARLIDAAFEVFADVGFEAATVEDICGAAGFSRGAFYSNFETKEELFSALWTTYAATLLAGLSALVDQLEESPDRLEETIDEMILHATRDRRWFLVSTEFLLHCLRHPDSAAAHAEHRREFRIGLVRVLTKVFENRGTPRSDAEVAWCARQLQAAIEGSQRQVWMEPDTLSDGRLQIDMVRKLIE